MAISQTQIIDYLNKKVGYGVAKTDTSTAKYPFNESIASPLLTPGQYVWQQDYAIPVVSSAPSANTIINGSTIVSVYNTNTSAVVQSTALSESISNETWSTGITNWIPPSFGSGYQLKLYAGPSGANASTAATYTNLPVAGSGNNDSWFFDYQAGIVNFADTNVPTAVSGNVVYVMGAVYTGALGISTFANINTIGNITSVNGNIVLTNGNITAQNYYGTFQGTVTGTVVSTPALSNVANYDSITTVTTSPNTFYLELANVSSGNSISGVSTNLSYVPSSGNLTAGYFVGNAAYMSGLPTVGPAGYYQQANVSYYSNITPLSTNATFYPTFSNLSVSGNSIVGVNNNLSFNPSSGNLTATAFVGSGAYLTGLPGTVPAGYYGQANVSYYANITPLTTNQTFYPTFSNLSATGNSIVGVNSGLSYNPSTNTLTAGTFSGTVASTNVSGTVATANVAVYEEVTAFTTNQTFYPMFSNTSASGNTLAGVSSSLAYNPSTGALTATSFSGSGASLTNLTSTNITGTVATANVAISNQLTASSINQTFYPAFYNLTTGNAVPFTNSTLNFNPSTGTLSASTFSGGSGSFSTVSASGVVTITDSTNNNLTGYNNGALQVTGGVGIGGNLYVAGNITVAGTTTTVNQETITGNEVVAGTVTANSTAASTSFTTGQALLVAGGVGIVNAAYIGGGIQNSPIGNTTPSTGNFTTITGGSFNGIIGNVTPNTGNFSTLTATTVNAATIGNVGATLVGTLASTNVSGTVASANVALYDQVTSTSTNATFYPMFSATSSTGNTAPGVNSGLTYNPGTNTLSSGTFSGAVTASTITATNITQITNATNNNLLNYSNGALQVTGGGGFGGNLYVSGNLYVGGNINLSTANVAVIQGNSAQFFGNVAGFGALYAGISSGYVVQPQTVIQASENFNGYAQINNQNINSGTSASADFVATMDTGTATSGYIDMGINSSGWNGALNNQTQSYAGDGYLITVANATGSLGNLLIGTSAPTGNIFFVTGGQNNNNLVMEITTANTVVVTNSQSATSTTTGAFQVQGGVGVQGALYAGSVFDSGNRVLSTSSGAGNLAISGTAVTLAQTGPGAIQVGGVGQIPVITFDAYGRVATASNSSFSTTFTLNGTTGTTSVNSGSTLSFASTNGVTITVGTEYANIATPQDIRTTASPTFNALVSSTTISAASVYAATIGNSGATLTGTISTAAQPNITSVGTLSGLTVSGTTSLNTATAASLQATSIGNVTPGTGAFTTLSATGASTLNTVTGASFQGIIGNATPATAFFTTANATTVNAATIGNIGTSLVGTLAATSVSGTVTTANVAVYNEVIALSNNQNYYPMFSNTATTGNTTSGVSSTLYYNPSTGTLYATNFVGTVQGTISTANVTVYEEVTATTNNASYYPMLSSQSTNGNVQAAVNSSLSYNPSTGALNATTFNGAGTGLTGTASSLSVNYATSAGSASSATNATNTTNVNIGTASGSDYIVMSPSSTGYNGLGVRSALTYNSTTDTLNANNFTACLAVISGAASTSTVSGALQVVGGAGITGNAYIGGVGYFGPVNSTVGLANPLAVFTGNVNSYTQVQIQNINAGGANNSADFIATAPNGTDSANFIDMGINGNAWSNSSWTVSGANDGYLFVDGGNLTLGTDTLGKNVVVHVGGTFANNIVATFNANNVQPTNATTGTFTVTGGAGISGNLFVGNAAVLNSSQTAGQDFIVRGKTDSTLVWARPGASYDQVLIGGSATTANLVQYAKLAINSVDSMLIPVGTTSQRPSGLGGSDITGMFRYNTTVGAIEWYNGTIWQSASTAFTVIVDQQFTGTGSQTAFTLSQSATTAGVIVSINGVVQIPTLAYSVSGTTLTFTEAPLSTDVIDVRLLTTTSTVTGLSSTTGKAQVIVDDTNGITFESGTGALPVFNMPIGGGLVSLDANVSIATANSPTTIDSFSTSTYRTAKYIVQVTNGTSFQSQEALVVHNGTTPTIVTYSVVQTGGNLGVMSASISGSTVSVQFTAANATNTVRLYRQYLQL